MRIATPCHEDWSRMDPRRSGRHCAACDKTVVDLTALTAGGRRTALAAIEREIGRGQRVCVRGAVDRDGALAGSRRALTGGMALLLATTMAGCQGDGPQLGHQAPAPVHATPASEPRAATAPLPSPQAVPPSVDARQPEPPREAVIHTLGEAEMAPLPVEPVADQPVLMGAMVLPRPDPGLPKASN